MMIIGVSNLVHELYLMQDVYVCGELQIFTGQTSVTRSCGENRTGASVKAHATKKVDLPLAHCKKVR